MMTSWIQEIFIEFEFRLKSIQKCRKFAILPTYTEKISNRNTRSTQNFVKILTIGGNNVIIGVIQNFGDCDQEQMSK